MNDADIEMLELRSEANRISKLEKKGICFHSTLQFWKCLKCGKDFKNENAFFEEQDNLRSEYL